MTAEIALADAGVFAGLGGLRGLTECDEFWARQPYGTRLYYVPRRSEYLHRDVLRGAVKCLDARQGVERRLGMTPEQLLDENNRLREQRDDLVRQLERLRKSGDYAAGWNEAVLAVLDMHRNLRQKPDGAKMEEPSNCGTGGQA